MRGVLDGTITERRPGGPRSRTGERTGDRAGAPDRLDGDDIEIIADAPAPQEPKRREPESELLAGTAYGEMFDPDPVVDPRFVARLDDVAREQRRRNGHRTAAAIGVLVLAGLVALVAASGLFAARSIAVEGAAHESAAAVRAAAGVHGAPSMLRLDTGAVARRVERLPWVADASVSIRWPNTLVIRITEWEPVAYTPARGGEFALLASNGRVLDDVKVRPSAYLKVVGVASLPPAGSTIAGGSAVDLVDRLPQRLRRQVVGLDLADGGVALRVGGNLPVRFGDATDVAAKAQAALAVLGDLQPGCRYVDVSVPNAPVCGP
jgi:cell division protein FtsQ